MEKALLYDEVKRIVGKPIRLIRIKNHSELYNILNDPTTPDIVRILLHYQNGGDKNLISGHWCAMIIDKNRKIIYYYDSYGDKVDATLKYIPAYKRLEFEQDDKFIDKFLVYAMNNGYEIHYNDHKHQRNGRGINTCGRYSACFLKYGNPGSGGVIEDFHKFLTNYKKHNNCTSYDDAIVKLTKNYFNNTN